MAIELSDGFFVRLKPKYTPNLRRELGKIINRAQKSKVDADSVDSSYEAVAIFIDKVYKVSEEGETDNLGLNALMDLDYTDFQKVLDAILEMVRHDAGVYKTIGLTFGMIELSDEELEKMQKKMN